MHGKPAGRLLQYTVFCHELILEASGYTIDSVEVAFIVAPSQVDSFRITPSNVHGSGLLNSYTRYGTAPMEDDSHKRINIAGRT